MDADNLRVTDSDTWAGLYDEVVALRAEAFAEDDPVKLRMELVQVAAVAQAWIEAINRREDRSLDQMPMTRIGEKP